MTQYLGAWLDPIYQKTIMGIFSYMGAIGLILFPLRKKSINFKTAWMIYLSWLGALPIVCAILGLSYPIPLIGFAIIALLALKEFFKMTGLYTQYLFAWTIYATTVGAVLLIHYEYYYLYNILPMFLLGILFLIPLLKNEFKGMLQFTALSTIAYIFIGWSFLHLAILTKWQDGARYIVYIVILTEFYDTIILSWSKLFGKINYIEKIAPRRSLEGMIIGIISTLLLARGIRNVLPVEGDIYWIVSGLIASLVGGLGDISMGVLRRDLGIKDVGAYIFGRGGIIDRMDRLIYVAPIYYYALILIQKYA
ncbi:MAG: phosphatidate cytidylyltransferase [Bdellovibrionales bacterium]|nr:phosphatidate cytidylyltransferase [Bdellovibrionales bacterium]